MEVLNQNQRKSALWRLGSLNFLILSLIVVVFLSMLKSCSSNGLDDLAKLKLEYEATQINWDDEKGSLENEILRLKDELQQCQEKLKDPSEIIEIMEARLEEKDDRIKTLNEDLTRCQTQLNQLNNM